MPRVLRSIRAGVRRSSIAARGARRGFTIVELLVVIAVLAVLIALLLPTLATARDSAVSTVCLANLRSWGTAVNGYAADNNGFLPRRGQGVQPLIILERPEDWFNALPPYFDEPAYAERFDQKSVPRPPERSVWLCPRAEDVPGSRYLAYAMNMYLSTWQTARPDRLDGVGPIHQQVFMADGPGLYSSTRPSTHAYSPPARHRGYVSLVFLDAHAAQFSGPYVGCGVGDPKRSDILWNVPGRLPVGPPD